MPALAECPASRDCGSVAPSRTAAIGGTRVARRAGTMLASSVIAGAEQQRDDDRARRDDRRRLRQLDAQRAEQRDQALGDPDPEHEADHRGEEPDHEALEPTERMTCLREAPSVRSVANSRVRWATVIDSVLKITNAPTSSAMAPNAEQEVA